MGADLQEPPDTLSRHWGTVIPEQKITDFTSLCYLESLWNCDMTVWWILSSSSQSSFPWLFEDDVFLGVIQPCKIMFQHNNKQSITRTTLKKRKIFAGVQHKAVTVWTTRDLAIVLSKINLFYHLPINNILSMHINITTDKNKKIVCSLSANRKDLLFILKPGLHSKNCSEKFRESDGLINLQSIG